MDYKDLQDKDRQNEFDSSAHENPNASAFFAENGLATNVPSRVSVARSGDKSQDTNSYPTNSNLARNGGSVPFARRFKRGI